MEQSIPVAAVAVQVPPRPAKTIYPEPFASRVAGRTKRVLGDLFGLTNFGVNLTALPPKAMSALRRAHAKQDEFVYVLEGEVALLAHHPQAQAHGLGVGPGGAVELPLVLVARGAGHHSHPPAATVR